MGPLGTPWQDLVTFSAGYRARTLEALLAAFAAAGRAVPRGVLASVAQDLLRDARADGSTAIVRSMEVYFDRDGVAHVDRETPPTAQALAALFLAAGSPAPPASRELVRSCVDAIAGAPGSWRLSRVPAETTPVIEPIAVVTTQPVQPVVSEPPLEKRPVFRHVVTRAKPVSLLTAPPARLDKRMEASARLELASSRSRATMMLLFALIFAAATASIAVWS
jgi:hypothetical protein